MSDDNGAAVETTHNEGLLDGLRHEDEELKDKAVDAMSDARDRVEDAVGNIKDSLDTDDDGSIMDDVKDRATGLIGKAKGMLGGDKDAEKPASE